MRILADLNIAPRTVEFLRLLGNDVIRANELLPLTAADDTIVSKAIELDRVVLTQDLDFTGIIALSGLSRPSMLLLRISSSEVDRVNRVLERAIRSSESDLAAGAIVTIDDLRIRTRRLPIA